MTKKINYGHVSNGVDISFVGELKDESINQWVFCLG